MIVAMAGSLPLLPSCESDSPADALAPAAVLSISPCSTSLIEFIGQSFGDCKVPLCEVSFGLACMLSCMLHICCSAAAWTAHRSPLLLVLRLRENLLMRLMRVSAK